MLREGKISGGCNLFKWVVDNYEGEFTANRGISGELGVSGGDEEQVKSGGGDVLRRMSLLTHK